MRRILFAAVMVSVVSFSAGEAFGLTSQATRPWWKFLCLWCGPEVIFTCRNGQKIEDRGIENGPQCAQCAPQGVHSTSEDLQSCMSCCDAIVAKIGRNGCKANCLDSTGSATDEGALAASVLGEIEVDARDFVVAGEAQGCASTEGFADPIVQDGCAQ